MVADFIDFVHACSVDTAFKMYSPGSTEWRFAFEMASRPEVLALRANYAFSLHHRCEPNPWLDAGSLGLLERSLSLGHLAKLRLCVAKSIFLPRDGVLEDVERSYFKLTRTCLWEDNSCDPSILMRALEKVLQSICHKIASQDLISDWTSR